MTTIDTASSEFKAINLACGGKLCFQPGWINADHRPSTPEVVKVNLLKPLPYPDNTFDVVYHSQFIEHLTPEMARSFMVDCYRVLKPGGIMRVVTPDFENQARAYLETLQSAMQDPADEINNNRYQWIRMEMLDQLTRNVAGGEMVPFLADPGAGVKDYVSERLGRSGVELFPGCERVLKQGGIRQALRGAKSRLNRLVSALVPQAYQVGKFRTSGEAHLCMFDAYMLQKMLRGCQFSRAERVSANRSAIADWDKTELDSASDGVLDCPTSLFMEAYKS